MARRLDLDRYLKRRGYSWVYARRVPTPLIEIDERAPTVRQALGTRDLAVARRARDILEKADDERWGAMLAGMLGLEGASRYAAAVKLATSLGYGYKPAESIAREAHWDELASRMERIMPADTPAPVVSAVLGTVEPPKAHFKDALKVYTEEIHRAELSKKSPQQLRKWRVKPDLAIRTFVEVVGDKALDEITRQDAVAFYRYWLDKISPIEGTDRWSASSGNRQLGELRKLYRAYFDHVHDQPDRANPFRGLSFKENGEKRRPAFSDQWIKTNFLTGTALSGLNEEARAIVLAIVETGARPSEICNLSASDIRLDDDIPHISIEEKLDPEAPRVLKTASSRRFIPLVGASLAAFQKFPLGFERYREKEESLSAAVNKYFSENGLRETSRHSLYSLRHSFEDRMLRGGFDEALRIALFGHTSDRPVYGDAGGLPWKREQLLKIAFPYDVPNFLNA